MYLLVLFSICISSFKKLPSFLWTGVVNQRSTTNTRHAFAAEDFRIASDYAKLLLLLDPISWSGKFYDLRLFTPSKISTETNKAQRSLFISIVHYKVVVY